MLSLTATAAAMWSVICEQWCEDNLEVRKEDIGLGDKVGLVKTHFYGIWVQQKILRPNHELNAFHAILSDVVRVFLSSIVY
jgi:hypothetical protein